MIAVLYMPTAILYLIALISEAPPISYINDPYVLITGIIFASTLFFSFIFLLASAVDTFIIICILQDNPEKNNSLDQPKKGKIIPV